MTKIHSLAVVDSGAELGAGVEVGPGAVIAKGVTIGEGTRIEAHSYIESGVSIGRGCHVGVGVILGTAPQDSKYKGAPTKVIIGNNTTIREYASVNRGTEHGGGETRIGDDCYIMAYSHIAHDCILGRGVVMANVATLAGHVVIEDYATVGGLTPIHQFARVGRYAFIGGASRVPMDVVPFVRAAGNPLKIIGINSVGLQRRGFSPERMRALEKCFRILFRSGLNTSQAVKKLKEDFPENEDIAHIVSFIGSSKRGISRRL